MKGVHHLTLQDRQAIQSAIEEGKIKAEIGRLLGKELCGISREINRHREFKQRNTYKKPIICAKRKECKILRCLKTCKECEEPKCVRRCPSDLNSTIHLFWLISEFSKTNPCTVFHR